MALYPVEIDLCPAFGWQGGPEFNTLIRTLQNGHERRNSRASLVRHRYLLPFSNIPDSAYLTMLKGAFLAMRGQLHSFLVKDHADYLAAAEFVGVAPAGSTAIALTKTSMLGAASYVRPIEHPVVSSLVVTQNGTPKAGTFSATTRLFTPSTAWTTGATVRWSGEFRVPVRFASDSLPMSIDARRSDGFAMNGSVDLVEVFGE